MIEFANETASASFSPDWVSAPGETIADLLDELGWKQAELARRLDYTEKHVSALIGGRASISVETAERLSRVLGSSMEFWLAREAKYQAALERRRVRGELASQADWLRELPLADMIRQGLVQRYSHRGDQVRSCLSFFGVANVESWRQQWSSPLAAFRASGRVSTKAGSVAAWLRCGELQAAGVMTEPWDERGFKAALLELRSLTTETDPAVFVPRLVKKCAMFGVAVVFVPSLSGCPASGATRWLASNKALLQLSLRYRTNDHLWFTFFHEAAHLLLHGKRLHFIETSDGVGLEPRLEEEANTFARDLLIPPADAARLAASRLSRASVAKFAEGIGVAAGIVVGRLQHERLLPHSHLNDLKVRYSWTK